MTFAEHMAKRHEEQENIGNAEVSAEEIEEIEEIYDSEQIQIDRVMASLSQRIGTGMEGSAFQREVRERFAEIGFVARCDLKKDLEDPRPWDDKPWVPSISIVGRTEKQGEFDHERMGHEVRSNILGKNEQGAVQKTQVSPGWAKSGSGLIVPD